MINLSKLIDDPIDSFWESENEQKFNFQKHRTEKSAKVVCRSS